MRGGLPDDVDIEYWWKHQCRKCRYRSLLANGTTKKGTCDYVLIMQHSRGCSMENCERFDPGPRVVVQKSAFGTKKKKTVPADPAMRHTRHDIRVASKCAAGKWLDEKLEKYSLKKLAKTAGFGYDRFNKIRKTEGAILPEDIVQKLAKRIGEKAEDIRAAEALYQRKETGNEQTL